MKRTLTLAALVVGALAAASIAVARGLDDTKNARALTGTFTATTASHVNTKTCTTSDSKALVVTDGTYTGTATGDPDLTGNATLHAHSVINTTDGIGRVTGTLRIDVSGRDTQAQFDTVYSGGSVAGLAVGHAHDPAARLIANLSAGFTSTGGFTDGKLGGSTGGAAVEMAPGTCRPMRTIQGAQRCTGDGQRELGLLDHRRGPDVLGADEPAAEGRQVPDGRARRDPVHARERRQHARRDLPVGRPAAERAAASAPPSLS